MTTLDHSTPAEDASAGMSRRALVRTGAIGAVAVPAITIAAAAPALAAATSATDSGATTLAATLRVGRKSTAMPISVNVTNTGTYKTTALAVTLTIDCLSTLPLGSLLPIVGNALGGSVKDASTSTPAGWTAYKTGSMIPLVGNLTQALLGSVTFRYVAAVQLAPGASVLLNPTITLPTSKPLYAIAGSATPGTGTPAILAAVNF